MKSININRLKTKNNKPDLIIWNSEAKTCQVVEISCPGLCHCCQCYSESLYRPLIHKMQLLYPDYNILFIPTHVKTLGSITTCLLQGIECLGSTQKESDRIINVLQQNSLLERLRSVKRLWVLDPKQEILCFTLMRP